MDGAGRWRGTCRESKENQSKEVRMKKKDIYTHFEVGPIVLMQTGQSTSQAHFGSAEVNQYNGFES